MGSCRKKNVKMLDRDNSDSLSSSLSSIHLDNMVVIHTDEVQGAKDSILDKCLDALFEKRAFARERALESIIKAFNSRLQHEFVEKKFATLLHRCLHWIKKGSAKEAALASCVIGLLALTTGPGKSAQEILEESISPISEALRTCPEATKIPLLECLAVITFVGGEEVEQTEESMQVIWQVVHPKLASNVSSGQPSPALVTTGVSAWSFILTTMDDEELSTTRWEECISPLTALLDKDDRLLRSAVGEALALIYEMGNVEKFCGEENVDGNGSQKLINQMRDLSAEEKDVKSKRNTFGDILSFLEEGYPPEMSMKICRKSVTASTWAQLIQLNFLKHFLGQGFAKHMEENEFLHDVFGLSHKEEIEDSTERVMEYEYLAQDFGSNTPKKVIHTPKELHNCRNQKRLFKSPSSTLNKERTRILNKQRILSQDKNEGYFSVKHAGD